VTLNPVSISVNVGNAATFVTQDVNTSSNIIGTGVTFSGALPNVFASGDSASTAFTTNPANWSFAYVGSGHGSSPYYPLASTYINSVGLATAPVAKNGNYSIKVINGSLTVVPADQLLITIPTLYTPTVYGSTTLTSAAAMASGSGSPITAKYLSLASGGGYVISSLAVSCAGASCTATDLTGSTVNFSITIASKQLTNSAGTTNLPISSLSSNQYTSTGGYLTVGNYFFGTTGFVQNQSSTQNFVGSYTNGGAISITPTSITLSGVTAHNKVYDGTQAATVFIDTSNLTGLGVAQGDQVNVAGTGAFASSNAGSNIAVNWTASVYGADASNYNLGSLSLSGTATATIMPAPLTVSLVGPVAKTYDGTTSALLNPSNFSITGWVGSSSAQQGGAIGQTVGTYASANVLNNQGTGIVSTTFNSSQLSLTNGALLSNYTFNGSNLSLIGSAVSLTGHVGIITPAPLGVAVNATYQGQGTTISGSSNITLYGLVGADAGDTASSVMLSSTGNVTTGGTNKVISITPSNGWLSSNYAINSAATSANSNTASSSTNSVVINPATLTYNANPATSTVGFGPVTNGGTVTGYVGSDAVNPASATTGMAVWTSEVTNASPVGSYAINGSGLSAVNGNYNFTQASSNNTAATVAPAPINNPQVYPVSPINLPKSAKADLSASKISIEYTPRFDLASNVSEELIEIKDSNQCEPDDVADHEICFKGNGSLVPNPSALNKLLN
jgi:hypothetical protein